MLRPEEKNGRDYAAAWRTLTLGACAMLWHGTHLWGAGFESDSVKGLKFNRDEPSFIANNAVLLTVAGVVGAGAAILFGYLYWRDWRAERHWEELLSASSEAAQNAAPALKPRRKPLVKSSPHPKTLHDRQNGAVAFPKAPQGSLKVCVDKGSPEVFVDNKPRGVAPTTLTLDEGRYVIEVRQAGCRSYRRQIRITAGTEVTMRPVLVVDLISPEDDKPASTDHPVS